VRFREGCEGVVRCFCGGEGAPSFIRGDAGSRWTERVHEEMGREAASDWRRGAVELVSEPRGWYLERRACRGAARGSREGGVTSARVMLDETTGLGVGVGVHRVG
jgi:hypothetical protein